MEHAQTKFRGGVLLSYSLLAAIIATLGYIAYIQLKYPYDMVGSEVTAEIMYARQVIDTGTVFPREFGYGYELPFLRPLLFAIVFDFFIRDMTLSYMLAMIVQSVVVCLSLVYLLKSIGIASANVRFAAVLALLSIPSYEFAYCVYFANGYLGFYIVFSCLILGYLSKLELGQPTSRFFALFLVLASFVFGLMGPRGMQTIFLPVFLAEAAVFCLHYMESGKLDVPRGGRVVVSLLGANVAGFILFNYLKTGIYMTGVPSDSTLVRTDGLHDRAVTSLLSLFRIVTDDGGYKLFSSEGLLYLLLWVVATIGIAVSIFFFINGRNRKILLFFGFSIGISVFFLTFVDWKIIFRYFIFFPLLITVALALTLEYLGERKRPFIAGLIGVGLLILWIGAIGLKFHPVTLRGAKWRNLEEIKIWAENEGYSLGYVYERVACNALIPMSNGKLHIGFVTKNYMIWLNSKPFSYYDPALVDTPVFFLVNNGDERRMKQELEKILALRFATAKTETSWYNIYELPFNPFIQINYLVGDEPKKVYPVCAGLILKDVSIKDRSVVSRGNAKVEVLRVPDIVGNGRSYSFTVNYKTERGPAKYVGKVKVAERGSNEKLLETPMEASGDRADIPSVVLEKGRSYFMAIEIDAGNIVEIESIVITPKVN